MRKMLVMGLVLGAGIGVSTRAHAQGPPPPIEVESDASQTVEMTLSLRDVRSPGDIRMYSPNGERVTRSQSGGNSKRGELTIYPDGTSLCFQPYSGVVCLLPLDGNPAPFFVYEFPSVVKGVLDPWFTTGEIENSGGGYLDDAPESAAASSFQHRQGRLDVRARVETDDIGIWDFREDRYHQISASASAGLGDWIYVTGNNGPTATLVVNASLDEEIDDPNLIVQPADWITEGVGDLRELPVCGGTGPIAYADQFTRFSYRVQVTNWELIQENWTASPVASRSLEERRYSYLDYPPVDICNADPIIVQQDTAAMPNADEFQATVPTNRWLSIDARVSVESECGGSLGCNLLAQSGDPVAISLSSPDGTIVSWQGVAGTTRVPEPERVSI